jgi:hypothetical protein
MFNKAAEENAKVKTTKNYLEGDSGLKLKDENVNLEKPKWVSKGGDEPKFVEFNKNEDVNYILNKMLVDDEKYG